MGAVAAAASAALLSIGFACFDEDVGEQDRATLFGLFVGVCR